MQTDNALQGTPEYVLFSLIFIVVGLTMVSASINLLVLKFFTLNTEDEKRDEQEAQLAARGLPICFFLFVVYLALKQSVHF